jgi:hypothetical protein
VIAWLFFSAVLVLLLASLAANVYLVSYLFSGEARWRS